MTVWLVIGSIVLATALASIVSMLDKIADSLSRINEHARIFRQHDIPEIVRHLEAINDSVNDARN